MSHPLSPGVPDGSSASPAHALPCCTSSAGTASDGCGPGPTSTCPEPVCAADALNIAHMAYVAIWQTGYLTREECIVIAKLLGKLSFTRHYGAYGENEWNAYAGDD